MAAPTREQEQVPAASPKAPAAIPQAPVPAPVSPAHGFTPAGVLALQRTAGNTAVTELLDGANQGERPPWAEDVGGPLGAAAGAVVGAAGGVLGGPLGAVVGAASGAFGAVGGAVAGALDQRAPAPPGQGADREAERGGPAAAGAPAPAGSGIAPTGPPPAPEREAGEAASAGASAGTGAGAAAAGGGGGEGPSARDPHADPRFNAMKQRAGGAAGAEKAHQPASAGAAAAQGAAAPPANDVASQAAGAQVDVMAQQQPGVFNRAAFIAAVKKAVDAAAPKNLEEADDFKESGKAGKVKGQVAGIVKGGKEESQAAIKGATEAAPDRSKATPKPVTPLAPQQPGPPPPGIAAGDAMPTARPPEETNLSAGPKRVDAELAEAGVTDEQLQKSNEPDFTGALKARDEAKAHSETAPADYRRQEEQVLGKSQEEAAGVAATGMAGMRSSKVAALAKAMGHQGAAKSADETKRAKVAADIEAIYAKTKTDVTKILADLDGKVETAFTQGEDVARKQFESYVGDKMDAYKEDRYSGWTGGLKWAKDKLFGMPSAVNAFYEQGKAGYLKAMDVVIGNVADIVGAELTAARTRIANGRADVQAYVKQLPQDLKQVGKDAEGKLDSQFDQLSSDVDNKQSEMVDALAQKYVAAQTALDERIEELKAANKGLVDKAIDAVVGVVKTILKLKDMLLNVLSKAASVIGDIIADPIGFLGNLVDGVKSGVLKFKDNIAKHLEKGLLDWLFGAIGNAGIKLPEKLDLAGILDLAMQVLGLTYENIRARVAKLVGEENVARMEQTVDVFKALVAKGVAGLWEFVKDKLGNLEDMVLGAIKDFVIERVIKGGITWIVSLLNPAAAFIKACKAIYDIVMWIVERGAQVMEFVNSILDSIGAIAKGSLGAVASKVEDSLAKALPVAISFLASLLGLGGISERIKGIIDTVRAPINKAVDWVVGGAVKTFKKMFGGAIGWAKGKYEKGKGAIAKGKAKVKGAIAKGKQKVGDALAWLKAKLGITIKEPVEVGGEQHTLIATIEDADEVEILMASTPELLLNKLKRAQNAATTAAHKNKIGAVIGQTVTIKAAVAADVRAEKAKLEALVRSGDARGSKQAFQRAKKLIWQKATTQISTLAAGLRGIPAIDAMGSKRAGEVSGELAEAEARLKLFESKVLAAKKNPLFRPGPQADPARTLPTSGPIVKPHERTGIQPLGPCHHAGLGPCDTSSPFTPDHQPPSELMSIMFKGKPLFAKKSQRLYAECRTHSNAQGAAVRNLLSFIAEYELAEQRVALLKKEGKQWK